MFIKYMEDLYTDVRIVIFYVDTSRRKEGEYNNYFFRKCKNYDECDATMTARSHFDIAWVRRGREDSHTAQNIKRRYGF
jgi:hypothetical protein